MASTITSPLHYALLILVLVQFTHSATIPNPKNGAIAEHKPQHSHTYIVHTNHLSKPPQFATLERWYASMVATHSPRATNSDRILYTYDTVMHGFAVRLTADEARRMSSIPGVSGVYKDLRYHTQTMRSPGFIGLDPDHGAWSYSEFGDGIIIGFVDTGILPEHASFNDTGLGPVRPSWKGKCVDAEGFNASLCNNKLVGAKAFTDELNRSSFSPRDEIGHGTHVSGTAAGSEVRGANLLEFSRGNAWGVAPKARIAMYKACNTAGCDLSAIAAAIDAAVKDGVDIISMSLGGPALPFYDDVIAIATFGAERKGVFVVLAGGNSGPGASTVTNVAPWMTTVGAATMDRLFPAYLKLGNGVVLTGQSLYTRKAKGTGMTRLVYSSCDPEDMTPDHVMGKVVVCAFPAGAWTGIHAQQGGAAGIVGVDARQRLWDGVTAQTFTLPGLSLSHAGAEKLKAYMASSPYPLASFSFSCDTVTGENRAPIVSGFSSRGPNPVVREIIKPDIIAPGVNVLAGWPGDSSPSESEEDPRRVDFNIISGTSMACPHVAGVAALIKKKHGDWTPAMVRSAMMTTAWTVDNIGENILDNGILDVDGRNVTNATPLVAGAGLVRPPVAMDPGLVYDAGTQDYTDFLCSLNYTIEQIQRFVPDLTRCESTLPGGVANLNYPSLVVVFDSRTTVRTLTRTVTKVSVQPETYNVTVVAPDGVKVTATPTTLEFKKRNEQKSYTVEFSTEAGGNVKPAGYWAFGHISWATWNHQVRSPVAVMWEN